MSDIYFQTNYGRLHEKAEGGSMEVFTHKGSFGRIHHMYIKRKIPFQVEGRTYYDLITPYEYGGPLILDHEPGVKNDLIFEFQAAFGEHCKEHSIVSEFVRFHPLMGNAQDFKDMYGITLSRTTVGTDLTHTDPIQAEFSRSAKQTIRRQLRQGMEYKVTPKPATFGDFPRIYYETMARNRASDFYYFSQNYFQDCLEVFGDNIVLVEALDQGKTIAAAFFFTYKDLIHAHLSGTLTKYLKLSPAYMLRYAAAVWGKENGFRLIHHGGGITKSKNNPLFLFKNRFGKARFPFYIGKRIWDSEIYRLLCKAAGATVGRGFFPAYRAAPH